MPGLNELVVVEAAYGKEWEYKSRSAMKFFKISKKKGSFGFETCYEMAQAIVNNIDPS